MVLLQPFQFVKLPVDWYNPPRTEILANGMLRNADETGPDQHEEFSMRVGSHAVLQGTFQTLD